MQTGMSKRDGHMLGEEWLDAEHHPRSRGVWFANYETSLVVQTDGTKATIKATAIGDFTTHGITKATGNGVITYVRASDANQGSRIGRPRDARCAIHGALE
ncbi:MAG: hypothetical protein IPI29_06445 [Ignavibacteria bacterium]|nr:hypothetical protein [Ignavibacteria bacterium]